MKAPFRPVAHLLRDTEGEAVFHGASANHARPTTRDRVADFLWRHRTTLLLAGILGLAALPRLWAITDVGLRGDEAVYAGQAAVMAGDDQLDRYFVLASRGNSNFLFYQQVVALFYLVFGVSDVAARLVAIGFSLGTVLVCFGIGRTLYGRNVGLLAALFVALSGYSVLLGRLALLDSTLVFLFSLSFFCFSKWITTNRNIWLYAFAGCSAMTIQAKVTGVLVLVIALNYLLVSKELYRLNVERLLRASVAFFVFFIPVLVQIALKSDQLLTFLGDSGQRATQVPWTYYLDKLVGYDGWFALALWAIGIAIALRRWTAGDRLLVFWVFVVALFFHVYPLKAFNYLLPLIPAVSILAARGVHDIVLAAVRRWRASKPERGGLERVARPLAVPAALVACVCSAVLLASPVVEVARTDTYFGLREAARWLKANTRPQDGVMTLSKGSAQYAISFYAHRDAYPFGRFRLATVFPGGKVRSPQPASDGPSRDWVTYWPPRLVRNREVSYLVYYTDEGDDPPENPLVDSTHQESFRRFIENYGGRLQHVVYRKHEARAWIYKVSKLYERPRITFKRRADHVLVRGRGFRFNSRVALFYHRARRGTFKADRDGAFTARITAPYYVKRRYWLVATDNFGNYASTVGLEPTLRNRRALRRAEQARDRGRLPDAAHEGGSQRGPLAVEVDMPKAVQVGSELPVRVRTTLKRSGAPAAESHLFFQIFSRDGKTPVRWRERRTNTLGTAYMHLATLELPGYYRLVVYASKGGSRGIVKRTFKVRRR